MLDWFPLPPGVEEWAALTMVALSLATSFVTAGFGIGGGVILLAALAVLLPPAALIPVHGAVQIGSNAGRTLIMLRDVVSFSLLPFLLGSVLGAASGGVLFVQLPTWLVQLGIAGFILWSIFGRLPVIGKRHIFVAGAVSGFLTMLFGATGSFVAAVVKTMQLPPLNHVATHSALMSLQHTLKIVVFGLLGFAFAPYLPLILAMILSGFVGTVIGRQLLARMGQHYFRPILNAILFILALRLIWSAVAS